METNETNSLSQVLFPWAIFAFSLFIIFSIFSDPVIRNGQRNPVEIQRNRFLESASDQMQWKFQPAENSTENEFVGGDVVWSTAEQTGYLRIVGLKANDPSKEQYQLWIFDRNQNEKTPIDGGVFNLVNEKETVLSFKPKLEVKEAYRFAITLEKPGGVVVSDFSKEVFHTN